MISCTVKIQNKSGLHSRPASVFIKTAAQFRCETVLNKGGKDFKGNSIIDILSACVKKGDAVQIYCNGEQEKEALEALKSAVENGLGE